MNILLSSFVHWFNAEAAYAAAVGEVLSQAGHRVWVLTRRGTYNGAAVRARGLDTLNEYPLWETHPRRLWQAVQDLAAFQARERIDVVNVFRARETPWHLLAARGQALPVVRTRGSARSIRGHWLNRKLYGEACAGLVAASEAVRHDMLARLRLPDDRVRTIYYPAETPAPIGREDADAQRANLLRELALPEDATVLGIVGRVQPEKGHMLLLNALASLAEAHPRLVLLLLDKAFDDPPEFRARVQAHQGALGLDDRVRWLGFRDDVRQIMRLCHVGVIPSLSSEVNCRVAVEFFGVGVPVVALPTGALPEVVEPDVSGALAAAHTPAALAAALEPLLGNAALRDRLAAGALRQAAGRFSRERFRDETLAAYEAALARKRSPS